MNDQEREPSGDGAGPVAADDGPCMPTLTPQKLISRFRYTHYRVAATLYMVTALLISLHASAITPNQYSGDNHSLVHKHDINTYVHFSQLDERDSRRPQGLVLHIDAGMAHHSDRQANFYNGSPTNVNTINRVLHSQAYGPQIWSALTERDLISDAIGNYTQLQIAEYGDMSYRPAINLSMGVGYQYPKGWGALLHFQYSHLRASGAFLIDATNGTGILSDQNRWVRCPIAGSETRISFDLGLSKSIYLSNDWDMKIETGVRMTNTSVERNDMQIAGTTYNILDLWNGTSPDTYTYEYDYINQGGIGLGGFGAINLVRLLPNHNTIALGYHFAYTNIKLEGYESFEPQHALYIRFELGNFSFLGN